MKEDYGGVKSWPKGEPHGWAICGGDILTVVAPALAFPWCSKPISVYLETGSLIGITTNVSVHRASLDLLPMYIFVFLEKLFSLKTAFIVSP